MNMSSSCCNNWYDWKMVQFINDFDAVAQSVPNGHSRYVYYGFRRNIKAFIDKFWLYLTNECVVYHGGGYGACYGIYFAFLSG